MGCVYDGGVNMGIGGWVGWWDVGQQHYGKGGIINWVM